MARQLADVEASPAGKAGRPAMTRKILATLMVVLVAQALFVLCLVSANQLLVPRNMPFGVAGPPSPVVAAVTSKYGQDLTDYPSKSAAMTAIKQGKLYGVYVTGSSHDTLIVVPAKSFFGQLYLEPAYLAAAHQLGRPVTVQTVKPLPPSDPIGVVSGLLLLPLLVGGFLAAVLVFKATGGTAAAPRRAAILIGYALLGAVLTDLIAGLAIGGADSVAILGNLHGGPIELGESGDQAGDNAGLAYAAGMATDDYQRHLSGSSCPQERGLPALATSRPGRRYAESFFAKRASVANCFRY